MPERTDNAPPSAKKEAALMLRLEPAIASQVRALAKKGDRTVSQQLRRLVIRGLENGNGESEP